MKIKNKSAFSLIEISIVILVIGIMIAGVVQGSRVVTESRLSTARSLTNSSDAASVEDMILWFDSTNENTLRNVSGSKNIENKDEITTWTDQNPQTSEKLSFTSTSGVAPLYLSTAINNLPALSFDGVNDYMAIASHQKINDLNNFTIFVVTSIQGNANSVGEFAQGILSKQVISDNPAYALVFSNNVAVKAAVYGDSTNQETDYISLGGNKENPHLLTVSHDSTSTDSDAFKLLLNGGFESSTTSLPKLDSLQTSLKIGQQKDGMSTRFNTCYISEIIIYSRSLRTKERKSVEKYLSKKWRIKLES